MFFRPLSLQDLPLITDFANKFEIPSNICDITPGCLLLWRNYYKTEICSLPDVIYTRLYDTAGVPHYNYPLARDPSAAISELVKANNYNAPVVFCTIPASVLDIFYNLFPSCKVSPQRQYSDYLYLQSDLAALKGRKFSGQRNQINRFFKENPNWSFEPLSKQNALLAQELIENVFLSDHSLSDAALSENQSILEILNNLDRFPFLQGAVLIANRRAVGFSLGEIIRDTLYIHSEKADRSITGAYQMMVNLFAKCFNDDNILYINREDDNGDEGLRIAKLAYHPYQISEKFLVKVI